MRALGTIAIATICLWAARSAGAALPTGPSHCEGSQVRATLVSFTSALNRGDYIALDEIFAEKPDFQWYSTDGRIGWRSKRRDTLIPYFRARHERGERLGVVHFQFYGNSRHWGNFVYTMRRSIPGVHGGDWLRARGKGAAVCAEGATRLIVMSYGSVAGR